MRLVAWPWERPDQGRLERGSLSVRSVACVQASGRERGKEKPACRPVIGKRYLTGKSLELGKAAGGLAAATVGWATGDDALFNAAVEGLAASKQENVEAFILLSTLGRGSSTGAVRNASLANSTHPVTGVPFNSAGYPNFSSVAIAEVRIVQIGSRPGDFRAANELAGFSRTPEGYSWHHHEDGVTIQLVPRDVHAGTGHTGGFVSGKP